MLYGRNTRGHTCRLAIYHHWWRRIWSRFCTTLLWFRETKPWPSSEHAAYENASLMFRWLNPHPQLFWGRFLRHTNHDIKGFIKVAHKQWQPTATVAGKCLPSSGFRARPNLTSYWTDTHTHTHMHMHMRLLTHTQARKHTQMNQQHTHTHTQARTCTLTCANMYGTRTSTLFHIIYT